MIRNPHDQRNHPWGNHIDPNLTNCEQTRIGHTNAVGTFLMAKSPYGTQEMSGNACLWTQSLWHDYNHRPEDGRENLNAYPPRLLRGGSYSTNNSGVTCYTRYKNRPLYRSDGWGFRVVMPR